MMPRRLIGGGGGTLCTWERDLYTYRTGLSHTVRPTREGERGRGREKPGGMIRPETILTPMFDENRWCW